MLTYVYHALDSFQRIFSRSSTWLLFSAIVLGLWGE